MYKTAVDSLVAQNELVVCELGEEIKGKSKLSKALIFFSDVYSTNSSLMIQAVKSHPEVFNRSAIKNDGY